MAYSAPEECFVTFWDNRPEGWTPTPPQPPKGIKIMGTGDISITGTGKIVIV